MLSIALVSLAKDHTYGDCYLLDGIFATCRESSSIVYRAGNGAWSYVGLPDLVIHPPWSLFLTHYLKAMGVDDDSSIYFKNYDHGFHSYFSLELLSGKYFFGSGRKNADACQATLRWYNFVLKDWRTTLPLFQLRWRAQLNFSAINFSIPPTTVSSQTDSVCIFV